ncbi:MAG: MFS transporter [Saprospiraceae bacterium]
MATEIAAIDAPEQPLYTSQFWLLAASHALFAASFTMIIPELPSYLTSLGGEDYKGLIIALFTLTAGLSRPWSGKLSDTIGRMPVMVIGTVVCVICSALYPLVSGIAGFLLLRLIHGFSTGFKPTASTAYLADIVPAHRRGEAVGIIGVAFNLGASSAPPFGSWIANSHGLDMMFFASSAVAAVSIFILFQLKETLSPKQKFSPKLLKVNWRDVWYPPSLAPAIVLFFLYTGYGLLLTVTPDHSEFLGVENKGAFFFYFTGASLLSRLVAGRVSDIFGRVPVIRVASALTGFGLLLLGYGEGKLGLFGGAAIFGFTTGIGGPAIMAWVIDRAEEEQRGRAFGTLFIALEASIGTGALLSAWIYANDYARLPLTYTVFAGISFMSVVYMVWWERREKVRLAA